MTDYRCIVADPPWPEYGGGGRGAQNHYGLLGCADIARVVLRVPCFTPATDAHLWVWTTDNYLPAALALIDRAGFRYVRTFCWVKLDSGRLQIGLGQYARGAHELCLFSTRGAAHLPDVAPPSVLFAPRTEHSRKPDASFSEWFERVSPGPRLEMFARRPREGWTVWGNEVAA